MPHHTTAAATTFFEALVADPPGLSANDFGDASANGVARLGCGCVTTTGRTTWPHAVSTGVSQFFGIRKFPELIRAHTPEGNGKSRSASSAR